MAASKEPKTPSTTDPPQAGAEGLVPASPDTIDLGSLVDNLPGMAYRRLCDEAGTINFLSHGCRRLTGFEPTKFLGASVQTYRAIIHADDRDKVEFEISQAMKRREAFAIHYRIITADGTERWVSEQGSAILDDQGEIEAFQGYVQDVSALKKAEDAARSVALQESQNLTNELGNILDNSGNEIYIIDVDSLRFIDVNRGARQNLGYTIEELWELSPLDINPLFTADALADLVKPLHTKETDRIRFSTLHQRKDGSRYPVEVDFQLSKIGETAVYIAITSDVTESKSTELELRKLNRALRVLTECNQTLAHATDELPFLKEVCRILVEVGGYRLAWVGLREYDEGKTVRPIAQFGFEVGYLDKLDLRWSEEPEGLGPTGKAIRTGEIQTVQNIQCDPSFALWRKEATSRGYSSSIALPIKIDDQEPLGCLNIYARQPFAFNREEVKLLSELAVDAAFGIRIIRARKERDLVSSELRKLSAAVTQSPASVFITDLAGHIEYVNPMFIEMTGFAPEEVIGEHSRILKGEGTGSREYRELWQTIQVGEQWRGELHNRRRDGTLYWANVTISPIRNEQGEIAHFLAVEEDIDRHKQMIKEHEELEDQLRQSQKLETIGTLAGGIAHDFNNVLQAILGFAEIAVSDITENPSARSDVQEIIKAASRARDLVRQILTFSRQVQPERSFIDLRIAVAEATSLLRATLPSNIEIRQDVPHDIDLVFADMAQIHQVLMNLGTNARQAMKSAGGLLELELTTTKISKSGSLKYPTLAPGRYARLVVRDTGVGMDTSTKEQMFNPFFTTKEVGEGTGLGLSVVHGIISNHGGVICVTSELGVGSTFEVLLPHVEGVASERPAHPVGDVQGCERVLCVDDEEVITFMMKRALEKLGYHVTTSSNSSEALELIRQNPRAFDVLVTDKMMPGLLGTELIANALAIHGGLHVILVSGYSNEVSDAEALAAGAEIVLAKPVNMGVLAGAIREVMGV